MRRNWVSGLVLGSFLIGSFGISFAAENSTGDNERTQEILDIWKEHVRTLTRERDDAFRQLEALKSAGPNQQFGMESAPVTGGPQFQELRSQLNETKQSLERSETQRQALLQEKALLTQQFERYKKSLESQSGVSSGLDDEDRAKYEEQIQDLNSQINSLRAQMAKSKTSSQDANRLLAQKATAEKEIAELKATVSNLQAQLQNGSVSQSSAISDYVAQMDALKIKNKALESKLQSVAGTHQEAEDARNYLAMQVDTLEKAKSELEKDKDYLSSQMDEAKRKVEFFTTQNQKLQSELANLKAAGNSFEKERAEKEKIIQEKEEAQANARKLEGQVGWLEKQLETAKNDQGSLQSLEDQLSTLKDENAQLQKTIASQQERSEENIKHLTEENNNLQSETKKIAWMEEEIQKSTADRQDFERKTGEYQRNIESLKADNILLAEKLAKAQANQESFDTLSKERESLIDSRRKLEEESRAQMQKMSTILLRNADLEKENSVYKVKDEENRKAIEAFQAGLNANLADIQNLKSNLESYLEALVSSFQERLKKGDTKPS